MPTEHQCPKCGVVLSTDSPKGLCPRCLLGAALEPELPVPDKTIAAEEPSERIGRYKLLQKLGEGGCGVVYMAEQTEPVRRRVALKVIKLGMDTKQVIARFEAERQALALMDHPNIAKVLDAGTTDKGRPYFVMELVKGIRITDYCDQNHLPTPERLALFTQVCQAIQHAHQKGIIHRDIKPSNILVTRHDGVPVPKVIDFGIAKATEQPLTGKTVFTAFGQFMGTPAYMSPEQAELRGLDIDTRSDIYALGVLLYELLTGKTPFDAKELLQAGLDEMRRRIREEEPMRPSTRLSTMVAADLTEVAQQRQSEPAKLARFVRGDLDWIVMKCLEKDRTRRYETANGLAADVRRHLENEPVVACPPSATYRLQKMVRRNKLVVAAVSAGGAALLLGFSLSNLLGRGEREARARAVLAEQKSTEREARDAEARMREILKPFRYTHVLQPPPAKQSRAGSAGSLSNIPGLLPPGDPRLNRKTYEEWAAAWWQWALQMPPTNSAAALRHSRDTHWFKILDPQASGICFLAAPSGTTRRTLEIPSGIALFFQLIGVEHSSLEGLPFQGTMADEQVAIAQYWADHMVDVFCEIDGVPVANLADYRVQSPQISLTAPAPRFAREAGGKATSSGVGFFIFLSPLSPGQHTLHYGGAIRMSKPQDPVELHEKMDTTYHLTIAGENIPK